MQAASNNNNSFEHYPLVDAVLMEEAHKTMGSKFARLVQYYLEDTASYVEKIQQAIIDNNPVAMIPPAHITKSASRQLGTTRLAELTAFIEMTGRSALRGEAGIMVLMQKLPELQATFEITRTKLAELLKELQP